MTEKSKQRAMIGLMAETNIHTGIGQSTGALDLPVARERISGYPFIPGSGVKGAFRVWAKERTTSLADKRDDLFGAQSQPSDVKGKDSGAGKVLMSDARLLLLPVRCMSSAYKWATCPLILDRVRRDVARSGLSESIKFAEMHVDPERFLGAGTGNEIIGLEEREFTRVNNAPDDVIAALEKIIPDPNVANRVGKHLVILNNNDFSWFAQYALPVMARNSLEEDTKKSKALWYEESLPSDTIMYATLGERENGALSQVTNAISGDQTYIQMGGNETIGQGWFKMGLIPRGQS